MKSLFQNHHVKQTVSTLWSWAPVWIGCTLLCGGAGATYAFVLKKDRWLASQAMIVRDEATGSQMRQGRFESTSQLKVAQELILDLVRNPQVIRSALVEVGPPKSMPAEKTVDFPSAESIREFSESSLTMRAPRGAELGSTEILYLDIKDESPERAMRLAESVTDALEKQLRAVRESRAQSMTDELAQARETARTQLAAATQRLQELEKSIGSDLPDLRSMVENNSSFNPRSSVEQLQSELRQALNRHQQLLVEEQMLASAAANPDSFINAPGNLLNSQPGLKRLREGLVDAQLVASQLNGKFTENHPSVQAARVAEIQIAERLTMELQAALVNIKRETIASAELQDRLRVQIDETERRIDQLANSRATYANVVAEVRTRSNILETAERELAEAEASRLASQSINLVTRVEKPVLSDRPIGPGKTILVGGSLVGGLLSGLALTFLVSPLAMSSGYGRRWNDAKGRRACDRSTPGFVQPSMAAELPIQRAALNSGVRDEMPQVIQNGASILRDLLASNPELAKELAVASQGNASDGSRRVSDRPSSPQANPVATEATGMHSSSSNPGAVVETPVAAAVERRANPRKLPTTPVVALGIRESIPTSGEMV